MLLFLAKYLKQIAYCKHGRVSWGSKVWNLWILYGNLLKFFFSIFWRDILVIPSWAYRQRVESDGSSTLLCRTACNAVSVRTVRVGQLLGKLATDVVLWNPAITSLMLLSLWNTLTLNFFQWFLWFQMIDISLEWTVYIGILISKRCSYDFQKKREKNENKQIMTFWNISVFQ